MSLSEERACWQAHEAARALLDSKQSLRFESDLQDGGRWVRYTPRISQCWACDEVIDEDGDCEAGCGGHG